jgi:hypothetical protein
VGLAARTLIIGDSAFLKSIEKIDFMVVSSIWLIDFGICPNSDL